MQCIDVYFPKGEIQQNFLVIMYSGRGLCRMGEFSWTKEFVASLQEYKAPFYTDLIKDYNIIRRIIFSLMIKDFGYISIHQRSLFEVLCAPHRQINHRSSCHQSEGQTVSLPAVSICTHIEQKNIQQQNNKKTNGAVRMASRPTVCWCCLGLIIISRTA